MRLWETFVSGEKVSKFKKYHPNDEYEVGDLIAHPKIGDGKVIEVGKNHIIVLFRDGYIKLNNSVN